LFLLNLFSREWSRAFTHGNPFRARQKSWFATLFHFMNLGKRHRTVTKRLCLAMIAGDCDGMATIRADDER
jgi:hypothetical protein